MKLLAIAILGILLIPYPSGTSGTGTENPEQPSIEWHSKGAHSYPDNCFYCDTDKDGFEEIFLYSISSLVVLDPPSYSEVIRVEQSSVGNESSLPEMDISIENLGGDGQLQIVVYSYDHITFLSNWTVFSGKDFSLLWKSANIRIPHRNWFVDVHQIIDLDRDGQKEFIWTSNDSGQEQMSARLNVYSIFSHQMKWISSPYEDYPDVLIENIDSDPAPEIIVHIDTENYTWILSSLQVFDGSTFNLQWELPKRNNIRMRLAPYHELPNGYYYPDIQDINGDTFGRSFVDYGIRDITNDGVKDLIVEHQEYTDGNVTGSGIRVYSGLNGTLEWNASTTGSIPEYSFFTRAIDILDADNDGVKELLVVTPNATGTLSNVTDIRLYSGITGILQWNRSVSGAYPIVNSGDIDNDGDIELLVSSGVDNLFESSDRSFEIFDVKENRSLWKVGPLNVTGYSELYAQDINSDGKDEIIFGNYTVEMKYRTDMISTGTNDSIISRSFQILNKNFDIVWTSPVDVTRNYINRMNLMKFDDNNSTVLIVSNFTIENGKQTNNNIRFFSMMDYTELGNVQLGNGPVEYHAEDIMNDSRKEFIVKIRPILTDLETDCGYVNGTIIIIDTKSFQKVWESPGFECINNQYALLGVDMTGGPGKELIFENIYEVWHDLKNFRVEMNGSIIIYNDTSLTPVWSEGMDTFGWILDAKDFDKDGNVEIMVSGSWNSIRLVILQFPRNKSWTNIPDIKKLDTPPTIIRSSGPDMISVGSPGRLSFSVEAIDPEGENLTYHWNEDEILLGTEQNLTYVFPPGDHYVIVTISDGYLKAYKTFQFRVNGSAASPAASQVIPLVPVLVGIGIGSVAIALAFAAGTEIGKYRFAGLLIPLYTRLRRDEILDHETRGLLKGFIYAEPGVHYNEILRRLNLSNGTASYHLMALEREGIIKSRSCGRLKRFYPAEMKFIDIPPKLGMIQEIILRTVQQKEGLSQREIARVLEISHSNVNRQVKKLVEMGFLRLVREGVTTRCYLVERKDSNRDGNKTEDL